MESQMEKPVVGVVMGSQSDWDVMQHAAKVLTMLASASFDPRLIWPDEEARSHD